MWSKICARRMSLEAMLEAGSGRRRPDRAGIGAAPLLSTALVGSGRTIADAGDGRKIEARVDRSDLALILGGPGPARGNLVAVLTMVFVSFVMYGPPVVNAGFYLDDWFLLALLDHSPARDPASLFQLCGMNIAGDRPFACVGIVGAYLVTGSDPVAQHALALVGVAATAIVLFLLFRRVRIAFWPALSAAALFVIYPGSDATRLWLTSSNGQILLIGFVLAALMAIAAIDRRRWAAAALNLGSALIYVALFQAGEYAVPAVALSGVLYVAHAGLTKKAIARGIFDLGLAVAFVTYRLFLSPVTEAQGGLVSRTVPQSVDRAFDVLAGAWESWSFVLFPVWWMIVVVVLGAVAAFWTAWREPEIRPYVYRQLGVLGGGTLFSLASVAIFIPALDYYTPVHFGLVNRVNFFAAPGYSAAFVGLLGLAFVGWSRFRPRPWVAYVALAACLVFTVAGLYDHSRRSQTGYAASWSAAKTALERMEHGLAAADAQLDANIISFGHPLFESGYIPVFAYTFDLKAALRLKNNRTPARAAPALEPAETACGDTAVVFGTQPFADYSGPRELWFVNATLAQARRIQTQSDCVKAYSDWGLPPYWGSSPPGQT